MLTLSVLFLLYLIQLSTCRKSGRVWLKPEAVIPVLNLLSKSCICLISFFFSKYLQIYKYNLFLLSVVVILWCREPWKKSGKPSTGMLLLIYSVTQIEKTKQKHCVNTELCINVIIWILVSKLKVKGGRPCWKNTALKQRN